MVREYSSVKAMETVGPAHTAEHTMKTPVTSRAWCGVVRLTLPNMWKQIRKINDEYLIENIFKNAEICVIIKNPWLFCGQLHCMNNSQSSQDDYFSVQHMIKILSTEWSLWPVTGETIMGMDSKDMAMSCYLLFCESVLFKSMTQLVVYARTTFSDAVSVEFYILLHWVGVQPDFYVIKIEIDCMKCVAL